MSHQEETLGQSHKLLERLYRFVGLTGLSEEELEENGWREEGLGIFAQIAVPVILSWVSRMNCEIDA